MSDGPETAYLHGTSLAEQQRLALMNDILNEAELGELALSGGERILDVGCGAGQFARCLARAAGDEARVVGVELRRAQLDQAEKLALEAGEAGRVDFRQGDAMHLPLEDDEWATFDVVHARFLLEHLLEPLEAVHSMLRAARPGGRIVLVDDDHGSLQLWPLPGGFDRLWRAYVHAYTHLGGDAYVGRKLIGVLNEAGAEPRRAALVPYVACAGQSSFVAHHLNLVEVISSARDTVIDAGELGAADFDLSLDALRSWGGRPDAAIWYALNYAEALRSES